ncbi:unnamed protein product [Peronospora belbahrii]|uniref:Origin recognition complex subunit 4 C-terminal domain-containing protein n=1 Tax=Peronospora belbahrii TaxID=622444 RepID=A0AAU9L987_9STRA|nr:unnamed protein product [Peronospora belbahrii]
MRTVQFGENQSGFLLGSMGSYRHSIVTCATKNMCATYGDFTNHCSEASGSFLLEYIPSSILRKKRAIPSNFCYTTCLIGFRQQTSSWVCLCVPDSRTSRSFLNNPPSRRSGNNLVDLLSFDKSSWDFYSDLRQPSADYTAAFSTSVYELFVEQSKFLASLEFDYDIGESQDCFVRLAAAAVYYISVDEPLLTAQHFRLARHLLEQDHQLAVLETVTEHGIALLIGMGHLGKAVSVCLRWKWYTLGGKPFFVFTTCLHNYQRAAKPVKLWKICCN